MPSLNISLSPELMQLVDQKVVDGSFQNPSEVISEALRHFEERAPYTGIQESQVPRFRAAIAEGLDAIDRGEVVDQSIDDILSEVRREAFGA